MYKFPEDIQMLLWIELNENTAGDLSWYSEITDMKTDLVFEVDRFYKMM